jgi:predicted nucleic-acid-binding protein
MLGIDTNILLRIILADSADETDAPEQLALVRDAIVNGNEMFFVNHIVLAETIWVLRQKLKHGNETIASVIRRLLNMSNVTVQDKAIVDAC